MAKNIVITVEELNGEQPIVGLSDQTEYQQRAIEDENEEVLSTQQQVDNTLNALEGIEQYMELLNNSIRGKGIEQYTAQAIEIGVSQLCKNVGYTPNTALWAMESYDDEGDTINLKEQLQISKEGLMSSLKNMFKKLFASFKEVIRRLGNMFRNTRTRIKKLRGQIAIFDELGDSRPSLTDDKMSYFYQDGKCDVSLSLDKFIQFQKDEFLSGEAFKSAKVVNELVLEIVNTLAGSIRRDDEDLKNKIKEAEKTIISIPPKYWKKTDKLVDGLYTYIYQFSDSYSFHRVLPSIRVLIPQRPYFEEYHPEVLTSRSTITTPTYTTANKWLDDIESILDGGDKVLDSASAMLERFEEILKIVNSDKYEAEVEEMDKGNERQEDETEAQYRERIDKINKNKNSFSINEWALSLLSGDVYKTYRDAYNSYYSSFQAYDKTCTTFSICIVDVLERMVVSSKNLLKANRNS